MNKYLKQILDFLLFSNVFIALCAVSQGIITYRILGLEPNKYVLVTLFFATISIYNFSILLAKPKQAEHSSFVRVRWIFSHYRLMLSFLLISLLVLCSTLLFLSQNSIILLFVLGLISISYSLPIWTNQGKRYGIRNIPGLKLFIIGIVWASSTVLLPIFEIEKGSQTVISSYECFLLFLNRFLFILAITIPFDIRDIYQDKNHELKTLPVLFGERKSLILCQILLFTQLLIMIIFFQRFDANFWAFFFSTLITGWLIFRSKWEKNEYYYFFFLDGTMILQLALIQIFNIIS